MRINKPLSQDELKQGDLMENGIYDFQVIKATEKISKSGNEMIELQLKVWESNGRERFIFDYLLEQLEYKIGHFAECVGLYPKYQDGMLSAHDCEGKSGQCKIYIQKGKDGYSDKNAIADYILDSDAQAAKQDRKTKAAEQGDNFVDDEIPF